MATWDITDLTGTVGPDQPQRAMFGWAYDPIRQYGVFHGGVQNENPASSWTFDGTTRQWTKYTQADLWGFNQPSIFWDHVNSRVTMVFGINSTYRNIVYYWDHTTNRWEVQSVTGGPPKARTGAAWSVDTSRGSFIGYAGENDNSPATMWELDLSAWTWTQLFPTGDPSYSQQRKRSDMMYDPVGDKHYLWKGTNAINQAYTDEVWQLDLNALTWTEIFSSITEIKSPHYYRFMEAGTWGPLHKTYHPGLQEFILICSGTADPNQDYIDLYRFDPATLTITGQAIGGDDTTGVFRLRANYGLYVPEQDEIYIAGGFKWPNTTFADTWVLEVPEFLQPSGIVSSGDRIFTVARDVIKVIFSDPVAVTPSLSDASTYTVTSLSGGDDVTVQGVLPVLGSTTDEVFLQISRPTTDQAYQLSVADYTLYDPDGDTIGVVTIPWTHNRTKVDSVVDSMPLMYGMRRRTNIRTILEAICISDEEIGGNFASIESIAPFVPTAVDPEEDEIPDVWGPVAGGLWGYSTW